MTVGRGANARTRRARRAAVLVPALWCVSAATAAFEPAAAAQDDDPLVELRQLAAAHADRALARIPALVAAHPGDPRLPFEQALLLTSRGRAADAIAVYERMVKVYPGLPEPFNNLGVLYAANGDLDRARAAFETALNLQDAARTAYSNLGQVNMRLAGRAYAKALHIDEGPHVLSLAAIQRLPDVPSAASAGGPTPVSAPEVSGSAPPLRGAPDTNVAFARRVAPPAAASAVLPSPAPSASATASRAGGSSTQAAAAPASAVTASAASTAEARKPPLAPDATQPREIQVAIAAWASAWSLKNLDAYFAAYVPGYKGAEMNAAAWQAARRVRILGKSRIAVSVNRVAVTFAKDGSASASFRQTYVADALNVSSSKTLEFVRQGGKWLIRRELAGS